jgi:hypothetical protein
MLTRPLTEMSSREVKRGRRLASRQLEVLTTEAATGAAYASIASSSKTLRRFRSRYDSRGPYENYHADKGSLASGFVFVVHHQRGTCGTLSRVSATEPIGSALLLDKSRPRCCSRYSDGQDGCALIAGPSLLFSDNGGGEVFPLRKV